MPTQASQTDLAEIDLTKEGDEVDPELLQLPDPPRKERRTTLLLMAAAAVCSAAMAVGLGRDAAYALGPASATDLGDLTATPQTAFVGNGFVQGAGRLGGSGALRYERPFESDSYRVMPVSGRDDVWVEVRVPAGDESSRYVPQQTFSGRLVPFAQAGLRHRGLRSGIEDATGRQVPAKAWLIVDGQTPADARWAVGLVAMFAAFALWNIGAMLRLVRKVK